MTPAQRRLWGDYALMVWLGVMLALILAAYFGVI